MLKLAFLKDHSGYNVENGLDWTWIESQDLSKEAHSSGGDRSRSQWGSGSGVKTGKCNLVQGAVNVRMWGFSRHLKDA